MCEVLSAGGALTACGGMRRDRALEARWRHAGGYAEGSSAGGAMKVCRGIERWRRTEGMCEASSVGGALEVCVRHRAREAR